MDVVAKHSASLASSKFVASLNLPELGTAQLQLVFQLILSMNVQTLSYLLSDSLADTVSLSSLVREFYETIAVSEG